MVIARQGAKDLAQREGLAGMQSALGELMDKVPGAALTADNADAAEEATAR